MIMLRMFVRSIIVLLMVEMGYVQEHLIHVHFGLTITLYVIPEMATAFGTIILLAAALERLMLVQHSKMHHVLIREDVLSPCQLHLDLII